MSNIMAAIGLVQLRKLNELGQKRQYLAGLYDQLLYQSDQIFPVARNENDVIPHIYVVRVKNLSNRQMLRDQLLDAGIETGVHYVPNHFLTVFGSGELHLPITEEIYPELLTLPLHPDLNDHDIERVVRELNRYI